MNFDDLLQAKGIDPGQVLALRHRPPEPLLRRVLGRLAVEQPDVFNAYQQTQKPKIQKAMAQVSHVASFIGHEPQKALFVGLYDVAGSRPITYAEYWQVPAYLGADNLLGRWQCYRDSGHGGNVLLRGRDPRNFRFSILQIVSPDEETDRVIHLESTWKIRLHTCAPHGLNEN